MLFREGIALLLRNLVADDSLYQAGTCEEALALVAKDPSIELVLMDINLPGTSGINAISLIRAEFPLIPVVGLSSSDDKQTILDAIDAGAMGFIPKSSSSAVLFAALQLVLSKGIYIPPEAFLRDRGVVETATLARADPLISPVRLGSCHARGSWPDAATVRSVVPDSAGQVRQGDLPGSVVVQQHRENSHLRGASRAERHHSHTGGHCGGPHGSAFRRVRASACSFR